VDLKLEELVKWSVWESFNEDPIEGWMVEMQPSVSLVNEHSKQVETESTQQINTAKDAPNLSEIFR
jgi:hypothetical protein